MVSKQVKITDRILVFDVHTTISDEDLRKELLTTYEGIKHVQRCYQIIDDSKTKTDRIQIQFKSPKQTEYILKDGFISIGNLRCRVKALEGNRRTKREFNTEHDSDCQSEALVEEEQSIKKILVHDVPTTIIDKDLKQELSKIYRGIKHIKRWYVERESTVPIECVQIDFESAEYTKTILKNGYIHIGKCYWPVTALKPKKHWHTQFKTETESDYQLNTLTEEDILEIFDSQKQQINDLLHHYDAQLDSFILHSHKKTTHLVDG